MQSKPASLVCDNSVAIAPPIVGTQTPLDRSSGFKYPHLMAARSSDIPWLSDPANNPLPPTSCAAGDTGCLHGAAIKWGYLNPDDLSKGVCVPTIGGAIATELSQTNDAGL